MRSGCGTRIPPLVVDQVLAATGLDGAEPVAADGQTKALREWLATGRGAHPPHAALPRSACGARGRCRARRGAGARRTASSCAACSRICSSSTCCAGTRRAGTPSALVQALRPLAPRLYSIASSREAVGEEAHLTVAVIDYELDGQRRLGAASAHLAALTGDEARGARLHRANERFRLPADTARDVIMIGPGTGVAPYRGFLQHREAQGARGRNWLLFGARHFASEFLYQLEWQDAQRKGRAAPARPRVLARPHAARLRAGPDARAAGATSSPGSRAAPTSTSAAMPSTWRPTSTRRSSTSSPSTAARDREAARGLRQAARRRAPLPAGRVLRRMSELSPVEQIKRESRGLRGTLVESLADPVTGALREDDTHAHQVPRQLPAGRSRPPRGAPPAEARARLQLHDPHAPAGRRLHAGAVARARRDRAPLRATATSAHHHAPGVPVPRRRQDRAQGDDGRRSTPR